MYYLAASVGQKPGRSWVICSGSHQAAIEMLDRAAVSSESWTGEESTCKLIQAVDRVHVLMSV